MLKISSTSTVTGGFNNNNNNRETLLRAGSASFPAHRAVVTCHSSWLRDQILNGGHYHVGDVVYLDDVCRTSNMTVDTFQTLLDFMYTGRTCCV